jgi:hypothetical protein
VIVGTEEIVDSAVSNPRSRKRRGIFDVPMAQRSGVRFTALWARFRRVQNFPRSEEDATPNSASAAGAPTS